MLFFSGSFFCSLIDMFIDCRRVGYSRGSRAFVYFRFIACAVVYDVVRTLRLCRRIYNLSNSRRLSVFHPLSTLEVPYNECFFMARVDAVLDKTNGVENSIDRLGLSVLCAKFSFLPVANCPMVSPVVVLGSRAFCSNRGASRRSPTPLPPTPSKRLFALVTCTN